MVSSMNSSSSSSRMLSSSQSPVPYRENPMDYAPTQLCSCNVKAPRWVSWSDANPGRQYYTCERARVGGSRFWAWHDPENPPFVRQLLLDLRDTVWGLKKDNIELKVRIEDSRIEDKELRVAHKSEEAALERRLKEKDDRIEELCYAVKKRRFQYLVFAIVTSFVVVIVVCVLF